VNHHERLQAFTRQAREQLEQLRPEFGEDPRMHQRVNKGIRQLAILEREAERRLRPKREPLRILR
jgi:hypothetical protein